MLPWKRVIRPLAAFLLAAVAVIAPAASSAQAAAPSSGWNDFTCKPSAAHPRPVVLVHGTFGNSVDNWLGLAPYLKNRGYCVFSLDYGASAWTTYSHDHTYAVDYVEHSAAQLEAFVRSTALPDTFEPVGNAAGYAAGSHPAQVDLVGHSQGGMMPRYLVDTTGDAAYPGLGDASQVHTLVGLAPSNHGTTSGGLVTLFRTLADLSGNPDAPYTFASSGGCGACGEQEAGSPFLTALDARPDAAGVDYYVIESTHDEVVTPYTSAFLPPSENVVNVTLQDQCPTDLTEHLGITYDPVALADVMAALGNNSGRARPLPAPPCPAVVAPLLSG